VNAGDQFGPYRIESALGRGGMGTVYLATHERLERKVAVKVITPDLADDPEFRARFLRESQLAASLDHPHVIPIYDADEIEGVLYLAMRYVDGPSLQALLRERGALAPGDALRIAEQIGGALDAAHAADLIHRDLKPANILLADGHAYLCDFGLAKRVSSRGITHAGSFLGTVDYCSPEQIRGEPLDGRADVYSLGCVLYHCLSGEPPYARESEVAVLQAHLNDPPPSLSADFDPVFARAMAKDRSERYPTAGKLATDLRDAIAGGAPATVRAPTAGRRPRRSGLIAGGAFLVALAAIAVAILATRGSDDPNANDAELRPFVNRIENVLQQSAGGRSEISAALQAGLDCEIEPAEAARRIDSVADNRQSVLQQLGGYTAPTTQADELVTTLQRALQHSIEADRHYRDGFLGFPANATCPLPASPDFDLATRSDREATVAKESFVAGFDPIAERLGGRTWSASEF
jgi:predicted Ser/Thr protein kinase